MSINNGEFDPNDPDCATPAVEPCEDPVPPPGGGVTSPEDGEPPSTPNPPQARRSRFLGTLSGPRNILAQGVVGRAFRSGFREVTLIPEIFYSSAKDNIDYAVIYDFESYLWNIEKALNPSSENITKDNLDNLRIFLKKMWIYDRLYSQSRAEKEYFMSSFAEAVGINTNNYTPGPGYMGNMRYTITGRSAGAPDPLNPGPEVFDSTSNSWISQINLGFDGGRDPLLYLVEAPENQYSPLPATGDFQYKYFIDDVFQTPLPFNKRELDSFVNPQFSMVTVQPVVNFFDESKTEKTVMNMKSLYRAYYGSVKEMPPECLEDDRVQKFSSDSIQQMKEANETLKNNYNQYVEISINTSQGSPVTTLMDEYQMDKYFLDMAAAPQFEDTRVIIKDQTLFRRTPEYTEEERGDTKIDSQKVDIYAHPLYDEEYMCINMIKSQPLEFFQNLNHSQYPLKYQYWDSPEFLRFTDTIRSQIFLNKMEGQYLTKEYLRSFEDIMNGEKARSEVFGYKIEKHEVVDGIMNEDPVQKFYFADSDKVLTIDFVDTQVVPGKTYVYRIYSLNLVFGSRYNYLNKEGPEYIYGGGYGIPGGQRSVRLPVHVWPYISIIEAPFYEKKVMIEEKPPLAPQASFVPFKGVDNKMQILVSSNFGEREEHPVKVLESDEEIFSKMRMTQEDRSLFGDPLEYATDSTPKKFQIFRKSTPPESYLDFAQSDYVKTIDTNFKTLLYIDEDNFIPNKDYYYMFRSIDRVGISNPSAVFKVRMVSYENGIFMDLKEYEMRPLAKPIADNMSFKRVLKIEPSFDQTVLVFPGQDIESRDFMVTAPHLNLTNVGIYSGDATGTRAASLPESIWGKKFKIRLTSKHSGKKIDLNVRFRLKFSEAEKPELTVDSSSPCSPEEFTPQSGNQSPDESLSPYASREDMSRMEQLQERYAEEQARREEIFEDIVASEELGASPVQGNSDTATETRTKIASAGRYRTQYLEEQAARELEGPQLTPPTRGSATVQQERNSLSTSRQTLDSRRPSSSRY